MSFTECLYGLNKLGMNTEDEPLSEIFTFGLSLNDRHSGTPSLSPGFVSTNHILGHDGQVMAAGKIEMVLPFPPKEGFNGRMRINIPRKGFHIVEDQRNLLDNHRVKEIDTFEFQRTEEIAKFVKSNGSLTLLMSDPESAIHFLRNYNHRLLTAHKYVVLIGHNLSGPSKGLSEEKRSIMEDSLTSYVSFLDLPYCIPIFDHRSVDGMGISFGYFWPKETERQRAFMFDEELSVVVSNHKRNVLFVDGARVNHARYASDGSINHLIRIADYEASRRVRLAENIKKMKEKEERKRKEREKQQSKKGKAKKTLSEESIKYVYSSRGSSTTTTWSSSDTLTGTRYYTI